MGAQDNEENTRTDVIKTVAASVKFQPSNRTCAASASTSSHGVRKCGVGGMEGGGTEPSERVLTGVSGGAIDDARGGTGVDDTSGSDSGNDKAGMVPELGTGARCECSGVTASAVKAGIAIALVRDVSTPIESPLSPP